MPISSDELRRTAQQIADAGHNGWGNSCEAGADEIDRLREFIGRQYPGFDVDEAMALHDVPPPQHKED